MTRSLGDKAPVCGRGGEEGASGCCVRRRAWFFVAVFDLDIDGFWLHDADPGLQSNATCESGSLRPVEC